jgi:hypothetical protein
MKLRFNLGSQEGRSREGHLGSDWAEFRSEFDDDGRTRHGVSGTELWLRDRQVVLVEDRRALAVLQGLESDAGERFFTPVGDGVRADVDAEEKLDAGRTKKVRQQQVLAGRRTP